MGQPVNAPIKPPVSVSKPIQDKQAALASLLAQTSLIDDSSPIKRYLQQLRLPAIPTRYAFMLPYLIGHPAHKTNPYSHDSPHYHTSRRGIHCTYLMQSKNGWSKLVLAHPQTDEPLRKCKVVIPKH